MERIHAAIGKGSSDTAPILGPDGRGAKNSTGTKRMAHIHQNTRMNLFTLVYTF